MRAVLSARADQPHINRRSRASFDRELYQERSKAECTVGHLKEFRAIATRYDKLAGSYLAMVDVALIFSYLRHLYPSDTA